MAVAGILSIPAITVNKKAPYGAFFMVLDLCGWYG